MLVGHHAAGWLAVLAAVPLAAGCRSAPAQAASSAPICIDIGAGSPHAVAQRSAVALADARCLADHGPRWGPGDPRFLVRFDESEPAGLGTLGPFRRMVRSALLGTGRFLVTEEDSVPSIVVGIRGPLGQEHSDVLVRGPGGELWVQVCGSVVGSE